tara:strand:- start:23 stop:1024 length:1002 start_codon:yes stop_codon:yes gene_type:complete
MKNLLLKLFFISCSLATTSLKAQYTEIINSNKPGFSESPYSVGKGVYQFENNFFSKNLTTGPPFSIPKSFGVDLLFRTSLFLEKLELNTQVTFQKDKVAIQNVFNSNYFTSGISKFTIGAKYLLFKPTYKDVSKEVRSWKRRNAFDKKRFIPSVAVYLGVNLDFINEIHKTGNITPKIGVLLQQNLTNDFNLISNIFYDKIGTEFSEISYIISATHNFANRWSGFIEHQGIILKHQKNLNLGTGITYLFNKDIQVNTSARFLQEGQSRGFYGSVGVSYRIDEHKDSFVELDENGKKITDTPVSGFNKQKNGFFSRIFKIFKKDKRVKRKRKRS